MAERIIQVPYFPFTSLSQESSWPKDPGSPAGDLGGGTEQCKKWGQPLLSISSQKIPPQPLPKHMLHLKPLLLLLPAAAFSTSAARGRGIEGPGPTQCRRHPPRGSALFQLPDKAFTNLIFGLGNPIQCSAVLLIAPAQMWSL